MIVAAGALGYGSLGPDGGQTAGRCTANQFYLRRTKMEPWGTTLGSVTYTITEQDDVHGLAGSKEHCLGIS